MDKNCVLNYIYLKIHKTNITVTKVRGKKEYFPVIY